MGNVHALPGAALPAPPGLNLSPEEVADAAGGYRRPADQLRELHRRGFVRAYKAPVSGKVVLERAHYLAVTRGQFAPPPERRGAAMDAVAANSAGLRDFLTKKKGG